MAPNTSRRKEALIDVNESLSSPHQVVLSHVFHVCQQASMQVSLPNACPFIHSCVALVASILASNAKVEESRQDDNGLSSLLPLQ